MPVIRRGEREGLGRPRTRTGSRRIAGRIVRLIAGIDVIEVVSTPTRRQAVLTNDVGESIVDANGCRRRLTYECAVVDVRFADVVACRLDPDNVGRASREPPQDDVVDEV